jgi:RNA 2',3'-cyclic 3'-phosphodiesterase
VVPDDAARAALASLLGEIERAAPDAARALRWTPVPNIHLTLHFLGNLDEARQAAVRSQLNDPVAVAPFDLTLGELGTFPPSGSPKILWIAVRDGRQQLTAIHQELAGRVRAAGLQVEDRPFSPHLTLGRVRDAERQRARRQASELNHVQIPRIVWHVRDVTLYYSDLSGPAPRYEGIQRVALREPFSRSSNAP